MREKDAQWPGEGPHYTDGRSLKGQISPEIMASTRGIKRERRGERAPDDGESSVASSEEHPSLRRVKCERSFVPSWLDRFDWLKFDQQRNMMFCMACTKYNKNNAFTEGCQNFRRDNLNKHMATNDHKSCVDHIGTSTNEGSKPTIHPTDRAASPITPPDFRHSSSDSRSSGIYSSASNHSLSQSPTEHLPSPPAFHSSRTPTSLPCPMPMLPYHPGMFPANYIHEPRLNSFHGEPGGDVKAKDPLPITPNYLQYPAFPYMPGASSYRMPLEHASSSTLSSHNGARGPPTPHDARNGSSSRSALYDDELVLKVRVAGGSDTDFIEIEIEKDKLYFDSVLSTICRELHVNPSLVHKLRKLPNTIMRKDKDIARLQQYQEIEVVLAKIAGDGYSPRHVDVVY